MDLMNHEYKILTRLPARSLDPVVHTWWDSVDMKTKEVYVDNLPKEFHSRIPAKDRDGSQATMQIHLKVVEGAGKTELRILVQMGAYIKSAGDLFEEVVCGLYKATKEKDPDCELKKGSLFGKKIKCDD